MKKVTKVFSVMVASVALAAMLSGCGGAASSTASSRPAAIPSRSAVILR